MANGSNGDGRKIRLAEFRTRQTAASRRTLQNTRNVQNGGVSF